ncbi:hypothetical protein OCU04_007872 [Sclerotinia nivalis]|uniref:Uncharacterized protein n=1 Tax=Sclerotinia nivalis TaxID=352851 RepID=A0A9X0AJN2_9HELO|nr:hypothetical protein OCU04_007872 [Sclerotinia nivalis]
MASEATPSVSLSIIKAKLKELYEDIPEDNGNIKQPIGNHVMEKIAKLRGMIVTISKPQEDDNTKFLVLEHHENPKNPIHAPGQPKFISSSTRHLLSNCIVFSQVFDLKLSEPTFDRDDTIAYIPAALNIRNSGFAIKDKCIYLDELMRCDFIIQRDGYSAIVDLGIPQIMSHLIYWNRWLTKNKLSSTYTSEQHQETLNVAAFFGANSRSLELAAGGYGLVVPVTHDHGSLHPGYNHVDEGEENLRVDEDVESGTRDFSRNISCDIPEDTPNDGSSDIENGGNDSLLSNSEITRISYRVSESVSDKQTIEVPFGAQVGAEESLNYVVILRTDFPNEKQKELAINNWGKIHTPSYIRCFKTTLAQYAPNLLFFFNARENGSQEEVGDSGISVSDGHVWDPVQSDKKKPYCHYPQMFYDEIRSDFSEDWDGHDGLAPWTKGETGEDVLWLAVQFWILFAECNGVDDPPQHTREELALKEDLVHAVGKWLGAPHEKLWRFHYTWGTKMRSDDPNNKDRKREHGIGGAGYYPTKGRPTKKVKK